MQAARRLGLRVLPQPATVGEVLPGAMCVAVVDSYPLGMSISSIPESISRRMFSRPIPVKERRRLDKTLTTGTVAWDALCPLGLGASMVLHGPSERLLHTLLQAPKVDRVVQAGSDYLEVFETIAEGSERVIKDRENILCILDMSKFPSYFTEAREATDVVRGTRLDTQAELAEKRTFYSQVFERAVCHIDGGTLTLVCQLRHEIPLGDFREMQSLSDGHIVLDSDGGINFRSSLSRFGVGSDTKGLRRHKLLQRVGSHIRTELCQFSDGSPIESDVVGAHLAQMQRQIISALQQSSAPVPVEEQIVLLVAASTYVFQDVKVLEGGHDAPLVTHFRDNHQALLEKLTDESAKDVDAHGKELNTALRIFNALQQK